MNKTDQACLVLLYTLNELNGGAERHKVLRHINDRGYWYKNDRNDTLRDSRKELVWRNDFSYERQHLVDAKYMRRGVKGWWEITEAGKRHLSELTVNALNQTGGSKTFYTAAFFHKLIQEQAEEELIEDQILFASLSQTDSRAEEMQAAPSEPLQPKHPAAKRAASSHSYPRKPAISQKALDKAGNRCEVDAKHPSFLRRNRSSLYMEPHHLIPMALTDFFGVDLDRVQNIFSLCSHCHNQIHYGTKEDVRKLVSALFLSREQAICSILGRSISLEELY